MILENLSSYALLLLLFLVTPDAARGQCVGWWCPQSTIGETNSTVTELVPLADGTMMVVGHFTLAGGVDATRVARFSSTMNQWSSMGNGLYMEQSPLAARSGPAEFLVVGGQGIGFGSFVSQYDGETNQWLEMGYTPGRAVADFAILPNGTLFAAVPENPIGLWKFDRNKNQWRETNTGLTGPSYRGVSSCIATRAGNIIVGGAFASINGVSARNIALYSVVSNTWSAMGAGVDGSSLCLLELGNGDVYAGGLIQRVAGIPASIGRFTPSTGAWSLLGRGVSGQINCMLALPNADILVGGAFSIPDAPDSANLARYSPGTNVWSGLNGWTIASDCIVNALALLPNGDLLVGGGFLEVNGVPARNLARYSFGADLDSNGSIDSADLLEFVDRFNAQSARADFDGDGVIDFFDYLDFVQAFSAGC